ncbi:MAG: hypothetical protein J6T80_02270, partial [Paludibacteraceae bacterium]|nr:hypothetical protein [Paludibacteraceae bacterium]
MAFTCALTAACTSGNKQVVDEEDMAVDIPASIVHNFDSIYHYEMLAFKQNDPKGLFITASVAYLQ